MRLRVVGLLLRRLLCVVLLLLGLLFSEALLLLFLSLLSQLLCFCETLLLFESGFFFDALALSTFLGLTLLLRCNLLCLFEQLGVGLLAVLGRVLLVLLISGRLLSTFLILGTILLSVVLIIVFTVVLLVVVLGFGAFLRLSFFSASSVLRGLSGLLGLLIGGLGLLWRVLSAINLLALGVGSRLLGSFVALGTVLLVGGVLLRLLSTLLLLLLSLLGALRLLLSLLGFFGLSALFSFLLATLALSRLLSLELLLLSLLHAGSRLVLPSHGIVPVEVLQA